MKFDLQRDLTRRSSGIRGFDLVVFDWHPKMQDSLRAIPGVTWGGSGWLVPSEIDLTAICEEHRHALTDARDKTSCTLDQDRAAIRARDDRLYPFQVESAAQLLLHRSWIIAHETGLGKSPSAIVAARHLAETQGDLRILVITPGGVRQSWVREFDTWWPDHPTICVADSSQVWKIRHGDQSYKRDAEKKNGAIRDPKIVVTSYGLLQHTLREAWDFIVFDEGHYLANPKSDRSKRAMRLVNDNLDCHRVLLTATPHKNETIDWHHQLALLWPFAGSFTKNGRKITFTSSRYGSHWKFGKRYCVIETTEHGSKIVGQNPLHHVELQDRLQHCMSRTTRAEVAHLLPPVDVKSTLLDPPDQHAFHPEHLADYKAQHVLQKTQEALHNGLDHVMIVTRHRDLCAMLAGRASGIADTWQVWGGLGEKEKNTRIASCLASDKGILVATMESIGIGINSLVDFEYVILAELHPSPEKLLQLIGRWGRLNSTRGTLIETMTIDQTGEALIADRVASKVAAANRVLRAGLGEKRLHEIVKGRSDDEWITALADMADDMDALF